jgi:ACS family hexuronate transporter-like MFS transporter
MRKIKGIRWWIIGMIAVATVINYIDRTSLAVMWPDISKEVELTKDQYATIVSAFMIAYAIGQGVSGRLFDWIGTRLGFTLSILVWSLSCALHGVARSMMSFSFFRGLLGFSEAGNWPGGVKISGEWFPVKERALANGIFNAGASLGAVISAPLIATLYLLIGWKATFVVVGALGIIWILPWWILSRAEPDKHPWITEAERNYILSGQTVGAAQQAEARVPSWTELMTYRKSWALIVGRFFLDPVWWLFVNWLPIYLHDRFGFDVKQIGYFAWVPYLGAAIGSILGGWWAGHKIAQGWTVNKARKWAIAIGGCMMVPGFVVIAFAESPLIAVVVMAFVLCGYQVAMNNIITLPTDFFSGKSVGSLAGMGGMSAVFGVLVFSTWLIPVLSSSSYVPVFLMGALLVPIGTLAIFGLSGTISRVTLREKNY